MEVSLDSAFGIINILNIFYPIGDVSLAYRQNNVQEYFKIFLKIINPSKM